MLFFSFFLSTNAGFVHIWSAILWSWTTESIQGGPSPSARLRRQDRTSFFRILCCSLWRLVTEHADLYIEILKHRSGLQIFVADLFAPIMNVEELIPVGQLFLLQDGWF